MPYSAANKAAARAFLDKVNATAVCTVCGRQPVEWHNVNHPDNPNHRIAHLVALGFPLERIKAELAVCTPYCRKHHMEMDGRSAALTAARPRKKGSVFPPKPCVECGTPAKPLRRGRCNRCYKRIRT